MEEKVRKLTLKRLKEEVKTLENVFSEVRILHADQVCAGFPIAPIKAEKPGATKYGKKESRAATV